MTLYADSLIGLTAIARDFILSSQFAKKYLFKQSQLTDIN